MCILLHNNGVGISGNIIYFLTCFVRIPARNSVKPIIKPRDSPPWYKVNTTVCSDTNFSCILGYNTDIIK